MNTEIFFEKLFINAELADDICRDLNISRKEYSEYASQLETERKFEIETIRRIRSLHYNRKKFFPDFNSFYKWYISQYQIQNGECYYCGTSEKVIATLFEKKFYNRKRTTRGKHLEIERRDSTDNLYNKENCVLACYFCNNDKSDIFDEDEYREYLKGRKAFLIGQYNKLDGSG
jgi:5-methylcytosine-specific restriction endonuclease McrA